MRRRTLLLLAGLLFSLPASARAAGNAHSAALYVRDDYRLVHELVRELPRLRRQPPAVLAEVRARCLDAGTNSPQDPESTQLSDEVIGALVIHSDHAGRAAIERFVSAAGRLRWHPSAAGREADGYVHTLAALIRLPYPPLCGDVRYWAADDFTALSPFTISFATRFMALWVAPGEVPPAVARAQGAASRPLARRAAVLEGQLADWEAQAVETYSAVMSALDIYP